MASFAARRNWDVRRTHTQLIQELQQSRFPAWRDLDNAGSFQLIMLVSIFALHHRITGEAWARDVGDMHAWNTRIALASGDPAGYSTPKEMGECYSQAFHAAAWRAGVPADGWDVP